MKRQRYPGFWREGNKKRKLQKYGLTPDDYDNLLKKQNGVCAICGKFEIAAGTFNLHVDHCHDTGKVRGLLCGKCNAGIALLKHNQTSLLSAGIYLAGDKITDYEHQEIRHQ
jgi:hypothetical protein